MAPSYVPHRLGLVLVLALAAYLRITGLSWGVPTPALPHAPFHPDEKWAMEVLKQFDPKHGDYNPEEGHREGTLSYFLWAGQTLLLKQTGVINRLPAQAMDYRSSYGRTLYYNRLLVVAFDLAAIALLYLALAALGRGAAAGLTAAFIYAITPFEVIQAHFMRAHAIANFFLVLTFCLTFRLLRKRRATDAALAGAAAGLTAGCRYTLAIVLIVPLLYLLVIHGAALLRPASPGRPQQELRRFLASIAALFAGFVAAFAAAVPFLLLDFTKALPHLRAQAAFAAQEELSRSRLMDFSRLRIYLEHLIPYGTLFALWVIFYGAVIYLLFRRKLYSLSLPLIAFMVLYLYPTAKGYSLPIFIRAALPLFPAFAILAALAVHDCAALLKKHRLAHHTLLAGLAAVLLSTLAYDVAYVTAMARKDPRVQMHEYLSRKAGAYRNAGKPPLRIGVYEDIHNYFAMNPTLNLVSPAELVIVVNDKGETKEGGLPDYVLVSAFEYQVYPRVEQLVRALVGTNNFILERTFANGPEIFGTAIRLPRPPHDLLYPFPTLFLLRRVTAIQA